MHNEDWVDGTLWLANRTPSGIEIAGCLGDAGPCEELIEVDGAAFTTQNDAFTGFSLLVAFCATILALGSPLG